MMGGYQATVAYAQVAQQVAAAQQRQVQQNPHGVAAAQLQHQQQVAAASLGLVQGVKSIPPRGQPPSSGQQRNNS